MKVLVEARVTVPGGGWSFTLNAVSKTITAGNKFPLDILTEFLVLLASLTGETVTVDPATGKITVAASANFTIVWTSTDLRNLLGFTGDLSGASSYTGSTGLQGLWIPSCPVGGDTFDPATDGHPRSDETSPTSPRGEVATFVQNSYSSHRNVRWSHVPRAFALDGADAAIVSWQQFVRQCLRGGLGTYFVTDSSGRRPRVRLGAWISGGAAGITVSSYVDKGSVNGEYRIKLPSDLELPRPVTGYTGYYTVVIPELIKI